jgi:hypothetical protein
MQPDGKFLAAGTFGYAYHPDLYDTLVRLSHEGQYDPEFLYNDVPPGNVPSMPSRIILTESQSLYVSGLRGDHFFYELDVTLPKLEITSWSYENTTFSISLATSLPTFVQVQGTIDLLAILASPHRLKCSSTSLSF